MDGNLKSIAFQTADFTWKKHVHELTVSAALN
jgi:hypothetical protein